MKKLSNFEAPHYAEFWQNHSLREDLKTRILSLAYEGKYLEESPEDWQRIYYNLCQWWGSNRDFSNEEIEYAIANYYTGVTARTWTPNKIVNATVSAIVQTQLNLFS